MDYPSTSPPAKIFILIGVGVLVFLLLLVVFISQALKNKSTQSAATPTPGVQSTIPTTEPAFNSQGQPTQAPAGSGATVGSVIATVGKESIYKADLDYQKSLYAGDSSSVPRTDFINKLVKDSIILQAGAAAGFISLDTTFFNSPEKNYILRQKNVQDVMAKIDTNSKAMSGYVVSIWFANDVPPAMGYEAAKQFALQKITALQQDVKAGKITIQQAGAQIKGDTSLAQIDEAYKVNAIFPFSKKGGEQITISKELDAALWQTPARGVTDVFLVKSKPTFDTKDIDAVYMFGQVTSKDESKTITNFDDWYTQQKAKYAVKVL